jgi:hypothetical protein
MIVIADTSPINYLVLIEQIEVLPKLYGGLKSWLRNSRRIPS